MPTKTYSIDEIAKLKQLVSEGVQVSQEIQDLREGLSDTVKAVAQEMEIKAATLNKAIKINVIFIHKIYIPIRPSRSTSEVEELDDAEEE